MCITLSDFRLYYTSIETRTKEYRHKNKHEDQQNNINGPEINQHICGHLTLDRDKEKHTGKITSHSIKGISKSGYSSAEE